MPIQIKPNDSAETPEYSKKLGQDIPLQKGIRYYEGELSEFTSASFAPFPRLPKDRKFICDLLGWAIYVPTDICTVRDTLEHLPEYVLTRLYNVMRGDGDVERRLNHSIKIINRDLKMLESSPIPAIAGAYSHELNAEKQRIENAIDFYKWWLTEKDTPLGEAYSHELVNIVRQRRSGEETVGCEVKDE